MELSRVYLEGRVKVRNANAAAGPLRQVRHWRHDDGTVRRAVGTIRRGYLIWYPHACHTLLTLSVRDDSEE
jgi:hypothetical protein